jgi:signal transduction histidine kinase
VAVIEFVRRSTNNIQFPPLLWRLLGIWHASDAGDESVSGLIIIALSAGLCVATAALVWLGYIATAEWRHGTDVILEERASGALETVTVALMRDMNGAWSTVLLRLSETALNENPPFTVRQIVARGFARFPYPESFIIWTRTRGSSGTSYVLNRADRPPAWDITPPDNDPFPVLALTNPEAIRPLLQSIEALGASGEPFVVLQSSIAGHSYQTVAHLIYARPSNELEAIAAFTVNLDWVRNNYFGPLLQELAKIVSNEQTLSLAVGDETGRIAVNVGGIDPTYPQLFRRQFPLAFIDRAILAIEPNRKERIASWYIYVQPAPDNALRGAATGARRTLALLAITAAASVVAMLLTVHAARSSARLALMKSEFVSAVTHELKTPLAVMRLGSETLAKGRYSGTDTVRQYSELMAKEVARLSRTVDNLLTFARYTDKAEPSRVKLSPVDIHDLLQEALDTFRPALEELAFAITVRIPSDLPQPVIDRSAVVLATENVLDNAIKYSGERREIEITATATSRVLEILFADSGIGIPAGDIPYVLHRFYRGRNANHHGSGLGLAIASRILKAHGGDITVRSTLGTGTVVSFVLPVSYPS